MNTTQAFLDALKQPAIQSKYPDSTIRTWRSRASKEAISLDFMVNFLAENGYHMMQMMTWTGPPANQEPQNTRNTASRWSHEEENPVGKTELGKKFNAVRKEMNRDLLSKWFDWCVAEYSSDHPNRKSGITVTVFGQMTTGRYISKENTLFAIKALKEGKKILQEYEERITMELETL